MRERTRRLFEKGAYYAEEKGKESCISCSAGVSMCRRGNKKLEQIYGEADLAMYQAKAEGKNQIAFWGSFTKCALT